MIESGRSILIIVLEKLILYPYCVQYLFYVHASFFNICRNFITMNYFIIRIATRKKSGARLTKLCYIIRDLNTIHMVKAFYALIALMLTRTVLALSFAISTSFDSIICFMY